MQRVKYNKYKWFEYEEKPFEIDEDSGVQYYVITVKTTGLFPEKEVFDAIGKFPVAEKNVFDDGYFYTYSKVFQKNNLLNT